MAHEIFRNCLLFVIVAVVHHKVSKSDNSITFWIRNPLIYADIHANIAYSRNFWSALISIKSLNIPSTLAWISRQRCNLESTICTTLLTTTNEPDVSSLIWFGWWNGILSFLRSNCHKKERPLIDWLTYCTRVAFKFARLFYCIVLGTSYEPPAESH